MGVKPLTVALVAAALFVVTIGVDASMNRAYTLQIETPDGWREVARTAGYERPHPMGGAEVQANRSDTLRFRLQVDNAHLFALDERYHVSVHGLEVASGELDVPARSARDVEFTVPASRFLGQAGGPRTPEDTVFASVEVRIGEGYDEVLYGSFGIREVGAG